MKAPNNSTCISGQFDHSLIMRVRDICVQLVLESFTNSFIFTPCLEKRV